MNTEAEFEPIDLDIDLSQVDTSIPVLNKGIYDLKISGITREENKDKTGYNLKVKFTTTEPATSTNDKEIAPGFPMFKYYPLQKKQGGSDKFDFRIGLASLIDACLGCMMENRPKFNSGELINKTVRANIAVVENKDDGTFQNEIKRLSHPE